MREDQHRFLLLHGQLPARLTVEQVGWVLNCQAHDVPVLVAARLVKPLGNPPPNAVKYFARDEIAELSKDRSWLSKATQAINLHWRNQNLRKKSRAAVVAQHGDGSPNRLVLAAG
jgi:hypothetical protein